MSSANVIVIRLFVLVQIFSIGVSAQSAISKSTDDQLIDAVIERPWPGENYPQLPDLPIQIRKNISKEIVNSDVREALRMLDAKRRNTDWFLGVEKLEKSKSIWALQLCLIHPHDDVQIYALRSMERLGDKAAIPFILVYAKRMAVLEGGSENATIHGVIHETIAKTMSKLTGVEVKIDGQEPGKLLEAIGLWSRAYSKIGK